MDQPGMDKVWAGYFLRWVKAYMGHGIKIWGVTAQVIVDHLAAHVLPSCSHRKCQMALRVSILMQGAFWERHSCL